MTQEVKTEIGTVIPVNIDEILPTYYMTYAREIILDRALPEISDGLKPVHRRLLVGSFDLNLNPNSRLQKAVALIGHVVGKYHPHGDSAAYEASIYMWQLWKNNLPLIYISGNAGSISGDSYAALRYTEVQLTKAGSLAKSLLDSVDYEPTFDKSGMIPKVLPIPFPNLVINGQTGIGCGITSNILPHNVNEALDVCIMLANNPDATNDDILAIMPGPDFPTGGKILNSGIAPTAYNEGYGLFVCECKYTINKNKIIVTEIPYQTDLASITSSLKDAVKKGTLTGISRIDDHTSHECKNNNVLYIITCASGNDPQIVMNNILSDLSVLRVSHSHFMNVLHNGKLIHRMSMLDYFTKYIQFMVNTITKSKYNQLVNTQTELDILEAIDSVIDGIDDIIHIIRKAKTNEDAMQEIMEKYTLYRKQAQKIVDTKIINLSNMNIEILREEIAKKKILIKELIKFISDPNAATQLVIEMFKDVKKMVGPTPRRTELLNNEINKNATEREKRLAPIYEDVDNFITLTANGILRRIPTALYRSQKRSGTGRKIKFKDDDPCIYSFYASANDVLWAITAKGQVIEFICGSIAPSEPTSLGNHITNYMKLDDGDSVVAIQRKENTELVAFITKNGLGKVVPMGEFKNMRQDGIIGARVYEDDKLIDIKFVNSCDAILVTNRTGNTVVYQAGDWPISRRPAFGNTIIKDTSSPIFSMSILKIDANTPAQLNNIFVLSIATNGLGKLTSINEFTLLKRPAKGYGCIALSSGHKVVMNIIVNVTESNDVMLTTKHGKSIRFPVTDIPVNVGRLTAGSKVIKLDSVDGKMDYVISGTIVPAEE